MKNILKVVGVVLCLVAFTQNSNAQIKFSAGADLGYATNEGYGLMYGLALGVEKPLGDNMGLTFQTGYDIMSLEGEGASASLIPLQAGFKYYFTDNEGGLYAHGQLGMSMFKYKIDTGFGTYESSGSYLSYGAGVGFLVNENIDLGLRYNMVSSEGESLNYMALRAAYNF
jgi:hypothetical protein